MANLITRRNITIANLVLLGVFVITLIGAAIPFIKNEGGPSLFSDEKKHTPAMTPEPEEGEVYVCPHHPEQTSTSPGKCPQCGTELVGRYAVIVDVDLFDAHLKPPIVIKPPTPPPYQWEIVGLTEIDGKLVAVIRDRAKRTRSGFTQYRAREGEEIEGHFGVKVTSITDNPPAVKYYRPGVGEVELKMGETAAAAPETRKGEWTDVIYPMTAGHSYGVRLSSLREQVGSAEAYRGSFGLEPNMEGTRVNGLKISSLRPDNLLYAAGLRQGDTVTKINDSAITGEASALKLLQSAAEKLSIRVEVQRGRTRRTIFYTLKK